MCKKCPHVKNPEAKGFWANLAGKECECACDGKNIHVTTEQNQRWAGTDRIGNDNFVTESTSYAFCSKCKHKFKI